MCPSVVGLWQFGEWRYKRSFGFIVAFRDFATFGKPAYFSMPKFLAGYHYNEEEISRHL